MVPRAARRRFEACLVGGLAVLAALRVLFFALAFPFFNNVDEIRHYDVVWKYAHGQLPRPDGLGFERRVLRTALLWGTPEYLNPRFGEPGVEVPPPPGDNPRSGLGPALQRELAESRLLNTAVQPPVYYTVAAGWWHIGRAIGLNDPGLVYWTRGLDALFAGLLVLIAFALLARTHASDAVVRLGVPGLLAVFPQDAWFAVSNDALSPLASGAAFALLGHLRTAAGLAPVTLAGAGLLLGLAFLVKYTNAAIVLVALFAWGARWAEQRRTGEARWRQPAEWRRAALFWALAALPVLLWTVRNTWVFGEALATSIPLESDSWIRKPLGALLPHPLLGIDGAKHFLERLTLTFWRGEYVWHGARLRVGVADLVYLVTSAAFVAAAVSRLPVRREASAARAVEGLALVAVLGAVATLVATSLGYDFPERDVTLQGLPTRDLPFVTLGRYVGGAVLPFLILYVAGIRVIAGLLPPRARTPLAWSLLLAVALTALVSEAWLVRRVLGSPYNAFHLP